MNDTAQNSRAAGSGHVSEEAVRWAYRLMLGREPESERVVRDQCIGHASVDDLRAAFIASDEFRTKAKGIGPRQLTGFEPPLPIETVCDEETMQRLLDHIARSWSHYGDTDPHWSVLTDERFRKDRMQENFETFDALGEFNVRRFLATLERNGLRLRRDGVCLELGCGVGRLTRWLAPHFDRVIGIDVSPGHLELARAHVGRHAKNVDFMQLRRLEDLDTLPRATAFYSFIVLQHNPPPIMATILERIFDKLDSGGIAYFHMPTYIPGYHFETARYLRHRRDKLEMEMHVLPQAAVFDIAARHRMQPLEALTEIVDPVVSQYFLMRKT